MSEELIARLAMKPHPEGGFFAETYRQRDDHCTAIYFLLRAGDVSRLHRLQSDELWHFYDGGPLIVDEITEDGRLVSTTIGRDVLRGETPQHLVPAGRWFGSRPAPGTIYALVGCTVAPGFHYEHFELATRATLVAQFPQHRAAIERLTDP